MKPKSKRTRIGSFFRNNRLPLIAALASGLYPFIFYYTNNFSLINSKRHLAFFIGLFFVLPAVIFFVADKGSKYVSSPWQKKILPFLNLFTLFMLLQLCLFASIHVLLSLGVVLLAALVAHFLYKHFKNIIALELVLAVIALFWLIPAVVNQLSQDSQWMIQPDDIEEVVFKKKPNIYYIQPDGYVNFSELKTGYYQFDNSNFESFLAEKNFKNYDGFRTNYGTTLLSNTSILMMKHHYFKMNATPSGDPIDARKIIVSENSVLKAFQHNGYRTHLISEKPYFLISRPEVGFDYSNFSSSDISLVTTGMKEYTDVSIPLERYMKEHQASNNFFFIQIFQPGHITSKSFDSKGVEGERKVYLEEVTLANEKLERIIEMISTKDPDGLILIMADHGGYVGYESTQQTVKKTEDRDLKYSIFSSVMAVRWPNNEAPALDVHLKSSVNMFRVLFTYLSEDEKYLDHLEDDASFVYIKELMTRGAYQYIDGDGKVTFKKLKEN